MSLETQEPISADDPYSHLAAAIIISAFNDLKLVSKNGNLIAEGKPISKHEIVCFFKSQWCGTLLGFQNSVSQGELVQLVMEYI